MAGGTVMIPVDGSENSERAFDCKTQQSRNEMQSLIYNYFTDYLKNIRTSHDKVILFHAYEIRHTATVATLGVGGVGGLDAGQWNMEIEVAKELVKELKDKYKKKCDAVGKLNYEFKIASAPAGEAIVKAAKDNNVKMIVMGSRGQGVLRRTFLGSVSDYVIHHSDLPTMVVP